jgi:very-short-patch-repair endonuclease
MANGRPHFPKPPPRQVADARKMRREMTEAERQLWYNLRHRLALKNTHFRRQVPIGRYIADFCCLGGKIIIEVDGGGHFNDEAENSDKARTFYLNNQGFDVLRFSNRSVFTEMDDVIATIVAALDGRLLVTDASTPTPNPSPKGGGETAAAMASDREVRNV